MFIQQKCAVCGRDAVGVVRDVRELPPMLSPAQEPGKATFFQRWETTAETWLCEEHWREPVSQEFTDEERTRLAKELLSAATTGETPTT